MPVHSSITNGCLDLEGANPQDDSGRTAEECGDHNNSKPVVPVPVVWVVPVAVGATSVGRFIVEGTAAKSVSISLASGTKWNFVLRMRDLFPAAQQAANFRDHNGHVLVLARCQPFPARCQAQVQAHVIEVFFRQVDEVHSLASQAMIGRFDVFAQVEGRIEQALRGRVPVRARKVIRHGQQPGDEIKRAREKRHFLFICHPAS